MDQIYAPENWKRSKLQHGVTTEQNFIHNLIFLILLKKLICYYRVRNLETNLLNSKIFAPQNIFVKVYQINRSAFKILVPQL